MKLTKGKQMPKREYKMAQIDLRVKDAYYEERQFHEDERGLFLEVSKWDTLFKQLNYSSSHYGVIRGMHVQKRNPQGKLVVCLRGEPLNVVYDLRKNSSTHGVADWRVLRPGHSLYLPPGTAHGFQCLSKTCEIVYLCTQHWDHPTDTGFRWTDVEAPWQKDIALLSKKDTELPRLAELISSHEWTT